jgi:hypothetical protein
MKRDAKQLGGFVKALPRKEWCFFDVVSPHVWRPLCLWVRVKKHRENEHARQNQDKDKKHYQENGIQVDPQL